MRTRDQLCIEISEKSRRAFARAETVLTEHLLGNITPDKLRHELDKILLGTNEELDTRRADLEGLTILAALRLILVAELHSQR